MFDFDHIEAWGPGLRRELAAVIPGDVSQAIASGKPKLIEDARDILLSKVDQKVVLGSVVNWLKLRTIFAYHGSRLTIKEIVDVRRDGLRVLKAIDREQRLRTILSAHPRWPTVERSLTEVVGAYGINWLQNNSGHREGSVHATISRAGLVKLFSHYLKYGSEFDQVVSQRLLGDEGVELLGGYGSPVIFKLAVPGAVAFHAANTYSPELPIGLPNLAREVLDAWAFWLANPTLSAQTLEVDCGLKFSTDVPPEWIIDCEQVADPGPRHIPYEEARSQSMKFGRVRHGLYNRRVRLIELNGDDQRSARGPQGRIGRASGSLANLSCLDQAALVFRIRCAISQACVSAHVRLSMEHKGRPVVCRGLLKNPPRGIVVLFFIVVGSRRD